MPKEVTYSSKSEMFLKMPNGGELSEAEALGLPLERVNQGKWKRRAVVVNWAPKAAAAANHVEIGIAELDPAKEQPAEGIWLSLDRDAINRLIRVLRRARDAAYGADA